MKHLFVEGNLKHNKGEKRLEILRSEDKYANEYVKESLCKISRLFDFYDFDKIEGTDYYYLYQEYGFGNNMHNKDEVSKSLTSLLNGSISEIANFGKLSLNSEEENDAFIDVNNNIILVNGEENLRDICVELLMINYTSLGEQWNTETEFKHISCSFNTPIISKLFDINLNKSIDNNIEPRKLIYK